LRRRVILSTSAVDDFDLVRSYLTQPGSGIIGGRRAARIARATADLANTADRHPADIFIEGNRQLVVERQFVSYRLQEAASGRIEVIVERVYGPGERRP
jgi:hypothetical protein